MRELLQNLSELSPYLAGGEHETIIVCDPPRRPAGVVEIARVGRVASWRGPRSTLLDITHRLELDRYGWVGETAESVAAGGNPIATAPFGTVHGEGVVVGVVDGGVDLRDRSLTGDGGRRVRAILDLRQERELHDSATIRALVASPRWSPTIALSRPQHAGDAHGTAVAGIACGAPSEGFSGGVAPRAALAFALLPFGTTTLGASQLLDALAFLDEAAGADPLVVNMSFGLPQGPLDGSSLAELACDEFTDHGRRPGRFIVKSAGNTGLSDQRTELTLHPGTDSSASVDCGSGVTHVECWADGAIDLDVWIVAEGGEVLQIGEPRKGSGSGPEGILTEKTRFHGSNGATMVTMSFANRSTVGRRLDVCFRSASHGALVSLALSGPGKFVHPAATAATLTVPASARTAFVASSLERSMSGGLQVAAWSGRGPTRDGRRKPDLAMPGVLSVPGRLGPVARGTSFSAALLSGYIAAFVSERLKHGFAAPNTLQLSAMLRAACGAGPWDPRLGHGNLVPERLLALAGAP